MTVKDVAKVLRFPSSQGVRCCDAHYTLNEAVLTTTYP
jgi:hypothetical protein